MQGNFAQQPPYPPNNTYPNNQQYQNNFAPPQMPPQPPYMVPQYDADP